MHFLELRQFFEICCCLCDDLVRGVVRELFFDFLFFLLKVITKCAFFDWLLFARRGAFYI